MPRDKLEIGDLVLVTWREQIGIVLDFEKDAYGVPWIKLSCGWFPPNILTLLSKAKIE